MYYVQTLLKPKQFPTNLLKLGARCRMNGPMKVYKYYFFYGVKKCDNCAPKVTVFAKTGHNWNFLFMDCVLGTKTSVPKFLTFW